MYIEPLCICMSNKLRFLCPLIVQALILESHTFNVDCHPFDRSALSFIPFLPFLFPHPTSPPSFHIPDPKLALLASRGHQPVSSADYEHGGCRPSREVTSLGGMLHVRHVRAGRKGVPREAKPTNMEQHPPRKSCFSEVCRCVAHLCSVLVSISLSHDQAHA